jgi:hypothetical protein
MSRGRNNNLLEKDTVFRKEICQHILQMQVRKRRLMLTGVVGFLFTWSDTEYCHAGYRIMCRFGIRIMVFMFSLFQRFLSQSTKLLNVTKSMCKFFFTNKLLRQYFLQKILAMKINHKFF